MNKKRPLVGMMIVEANRSFFNTVMKYLQNALFAANVDVAVFSPPFVYQMNERHVEAEGSIFEIMNLDLLDGLIIYTDTLDSVGGAKAATDRIQKEFKKPVICVEIPLGDYPYEPFIDTGGVFKIVEHLIKHHNVKTIDYVGGTVESSVYFDKMRNDFIGAMKDLGYDIPESRIHNSHNWIDDGDDVVREILSNPDGMPEAIVCISDVVACSVISSLNKSGISVPEDVIVCGYGQNEPYADMISDITSVVRDPKNMAENVVRRLLAMMNIAHDDIVVSSDCCTLSIGSSCGCDISHFSKHVGLMMENSFKPYTDNFSSQYNFMTENLMGAADYESFLWVLDWYVRYLGNVEGFWLCFNSNVLHENVLNTKFADKMELPYCKNGKHGSVDLNRCFDKEIMLPAIFEDRDRPAAFIFSSLHFMEYNYGYVVLSYGDSGDMYNSHYSMWLRRLAIALRVYRKRSVYEDTVKDFQIRDSLTGLLNMRGYTRIIIERCGGFDNPNRILRIVSVDVENLGNINDAFGYAEGDKLLINLAIQMISCVNDDELCVRVSGDEFFFASIVDANAPEDDLTSRFLERLEAFNSYSGRTYGINVHIATMSAPLTSEEIVEKLPYEAAYQRNLSKDVSNGSAEKNSVSSSYESFDPGEREKVVRILNENLFTYQYQPIVNAKSGEIFAYEALMRSNIGDEKIPPVAILKHAEALDRLYDVEKYTMFNLFEILEKNQHLFEKKRLFINSIPAHILSDPDFELLRSKYHRIMDRSVIEFTEQTEASEKQLDSFRKRSERTGFKLAVDDYGTGYSNISNLLNFSPDCVKIDRCLITNINDDRRKQHFVKNIIDYAHDNGFMALAEGVETYTELQTSISLGIDLIQGYYTGKPSDEFVPSIDDGIKEEIIHLKLQAESTKVRKTFVTGKETKLAVMPLELDGYNDVLVTGEDVTIVGNAAVSGNMTIRIKSGLKCHLTLVGINLNNDVGADCIMVGKGAELTLEIQNNVTIIGSINVPERSSIDIIGDGTLSISSTANQSYGIGCDIKHSFGNIAIHLKTLSIKLDSYQNVAIGGGYNNSRSEINIDGTALKIEQTGKFNLGIGCFYSKPILRINNSDITINERVANCIGIGSYDESIELYIENTRFTADCAGDKICAIGSYCTKGSNVSLKFADIKLTLNGKWLMGIGSEEGSFDIIAYDSNIVANYEGSNATAMGSFNDRCAIALYRCKGNISVKSDNGRIWGVPSGTPLLYDCEIGTMLQ
ncbi:MAG: EAL domain-containing protein [Oscillospiraceae bacterium]|nr:EAL domain-containing protein [Oscillospiraceae bacterium]